MKCRKQNVEIHVSTIQKNKNRRSDCLQESKSHTEHKAKVTVLKNTSHTFEMSSYELSVGCQYKHIPCGTRNYNLPPGSTHQDSC